jgi:DNA-binding NarL/FixJ family response regulator
VLLDIAMPSLNGIEAARRIRRDSPACQIVFLTQNNDKEVTNLALDTGAQGYVLKANAANELAAAIAAALRDGHQPHVPAATM